MKGNLTGRVDAYRVRRSLRAIARDAVEPRAALRTESSFDLFVDSAMAQGVGATAAGVLRKFDFEVPPVLAAHVENARFARAAWRDVIRSVDVEFTSRGIEWVALKGMVLSEMYAQPETRSFNDIDILVDGADLGQALDALGHIGATDINRNWGNYLEYGVGETPLWTPGIGIDLHWHVVGLARDRKSLNIDIASMLDRRRRVTIQGVEVPTLDPTDLLLHTALHAARSGGTRLVWLRDVDSLVRTEKPDWDLFVARAHESFVSPMVGQVLDRARHQLGSPIPPELPRRLCPSSLLTMRRVMDTFDSGGGLPKRFARGFPIAVSRATLVGSVRSAVQSARGRFCEVERWGVGDRGGPLYFDLPTGGESARADYLKYAATESSRGGVGE